MKIDDMAYCRGRDDARCGLPRFSRCMYPDNYGAYNAGWNDWHKLQAFPAMLAALQQVVAWHENPNAPDSIHWLGDVLASYVRPAIVAATGES